MLLSIIIINYNTFDLTCNCIRSVYQHVKGINFEIILVDNASPQDDPEQFAVLFPKIKLIKSAVNGGFAKGNNLGIGHATGDIILLLNSDAYLVEDCISKPMNLFRNHPALGALSVHITYPDGKFQHTARRFRSIRNELLDVCRPLLMLMPYRKRAKLMLNQYFRGDFSTEADWVSGAFMMFPKKLLQKLPNNKLDERFWMYGEDQLWCYQFREAGFYNYFYADAKVVHIANASTEPNKQLKLLKKMLQLEFDIMEYRKGKGLYYFLFKIIFSLKDYGRYYVKVIVWKLFGHKIR